ncbi:MAG: hypothetical protein IJU37_10225 [Desulfovibrio sp.]|nr:hypothetical protein [Desulfovibrio sp.]
MHTRPYPALRHWKPALSPLMLIGVACILIVVMAGLSQRSNERERSFMVRNLTDRAEALIWALEAGTRTGMRMKDSVIMGLSPLLRETARQPGIVYMAVSDAQGRMLAFSWGGDGDEKADSALQTVAAEMPVLPALAVETDKTQWRMRERADGVKVFEVYRAFAPLGRHHGPRGMPGMQGKLASASACGGHAGCPGDAGARIKEQNPDMPNLIGTPERQVVGVALVGFDARPFEEALRRDVRNNLLCAALAVTLAFGGFVSLSWVQQYRRWRRMLRDERAIAASVIAALPLGLVTSDPAGRIAVVNDTALAMFHKNRQDVTPASGVEHSHRPPLLRSLPGLDWERLLKRLAEKGCLAEDELVLRLPGAAPLNVSLGAATVRNEDNVLLGHVFVLRDITEMKRLQAEAQRNDRLTALGHLAAGVAHEVRNPLSTIKGVALYIARRMPEGGREAEAAMRMIDEVDRLDRVVSSLLEFARPDAFETAPTQLSALVDHALLLAEADLCAKSIAVERTIPPHFPLVCVNAERLVQALLNLFLNAVQAMEPGGTLRVRADLHGEDAFRLVVTDSGSGIAPELLASIFTPYFSTKTSGTGLGLALVHRIAEGHGGSITAANAPGGGAEFTLTLPLQGKQRDSA